MTYLPTYLPTQVKVVTEVTIVTVVTLETVETLVTVVAVVTVVTNKISPKLLFFNTKKITRIKFS